ncbi:MAG: hypothetical protein FWG08_06025 [Propionibacteriaceae bacterium]|nr:hypothetical protein [Propionibacteriaceae bacterium]
MAISSSRLYSQVQATNPQGYSQVDTTSVDKSTWRHEEPTSATHRHQWSI